MTRFFIYCLDFASTYGIEISKLVLHRFEYLRLKSHDIQSINEINSILSPLRSLIIQSVLLIWTSKVSHL
jgi:hypothetical protein